MKKKTHFKNLIYKCVLTGITLATLEITVLQKHWKLNLKKSSSKKLCGCFEVKKW